MSKDHSTLCFSQLLHKMDFMGSWFYFDFLGLTLNHTIPTFNDEAL